MNFPTIVQFCESLRMAEHTLKTLRGVKCCYTVHGEPQFIAGGNAVVFVIMIEGKKYALKCYFRPPGDRKEYIRYLSDNGDGLIPDDTRYLPEELWIWDSETEGRWCDVAIKGWNEGYTLDFEIRRALVAGDRLRFGTLARLFDEMAVKLLSKEWAHGDIKPENIIVDGCTMVLVDYGACYIPHLCDTVASELGTPQYQHPRRNIHFFNSHIDDYPLAIISATLHAFALSTELYRELGGADIFLFNPLDIAAGNYRALVRVEEVARQYDDQALVTLLNKLRSPVPQIEDLAKILQQFK